MLLFWARKTLIYIKNQDFLKKGMKFCHPYSLRHTLVSLPPIPFSLTSVFLFAKKVKYVCVWMYIYFFTWNIACCILFCILLSSMVILSLSLFICKRERTLCVRLNERRHMRHPPQDQTQWNLTHTVSIAYSCSSRQQHEVCKPSHCFPKAL